MTADRFSRQSFLGSDSEQLIARCTVGVPGLGGGGSHIVQQLAHIGFKRYVLYDDDVTEESNLNRLVGAESRDARAQTPKLHIAKMKILGLQPDAIIRGFSCKWQDNPEPLRDCQIVIGAIDGYRGRRELEIACRRYLMHYIDIGMDVHGEDRPVIRRPGDPVIARWSVHAMHGFPDGREARRRSCALRQCRLPSAGGLAERRAGFHGRWVCCRARYWVDPEGAALRVHGLRRQRGDTHAEQNAQRARQIRVPALSRRDSRRSGRRRSLKAGGKRISRLRKSSRDET
jgi:hypothetical protein